MSAAPAVTPPVARASVYQTDLFGPIEVGDDHLMHFEEGVLGFPAYRRWILLDGAVRGTAWFQSADHSSLAFFLVEPHVVFSDFAIDVPLPAVRNLGATRADELTVFALVTLPAPGGEATANLQGPLLMNLKARRGAQIVIPESAWGLRHPVPSSVLRPSA